MTGFTVNSIIDLSSTDREEVIKFLKGSRAVAPAAAGALNSYLQPYMHDRPQFLRGNEISAYCGCTRVSSSQNMLRNDQPFQVILEALRKTPESMYPLLPIWKLLGLVTTAPAPAPIQAPLELFLIPTGYDGFTWLTDHKLKHPQSTFIAEAIPFAIDCYQDFKDRSERSFVVKFYTIEPPTAMVGRSINLVHSIDISHNIEGPWRIRPKDDDGAIEIVDSLVQPAWITEYLKRPLSAFVVTDQGPVFKLYPIITGTEWLLGGPATSGQPKRPQSKLIKQNRGWAIDTVDLGQYDSSFKRVRSITIYSTDSWEVNYARYGSDTVMQEGPWRVRPARYEDWIDLFDGDHQPRWARDKLDRNLQDFTIQLSPTQHQLDVASDIVAWWRGRASTSAVPSLLVQEFKSQCTMVEAGFFMPDERIVTESYVAKGSVDIFPDYRGVHESIQDDFPMVESIQAHIQGRDRPIAQTVHTDHLDFQFDVPADSPTNDVSVAAKLAYLMICIFGGNEKINAKISKS